MIRKMVLYGQSSNSSLPPYHPGGIPLTPGYIELVYAGDPLAGVNNINVGKIKLKAWLGFSNIPIPSASYAEVLTSVTGSAFFPGGMGEYGGAHKKLKKYINIIPVVFFRLYQQLIYRCGIDGR